MEQPVPARQRYTVDEYLAMEDAAAERHEYRDGEVIAMAGGRSGHNKITENLTIHLYPHLRDKGCITLGPDQRVRVDKSRYTYPDKLIVCRPLIYDPPDGDVVLTNPRVIFEILSESTESVDRTEKLYRYMRIESLQEYVLIAQDKPQVETFYRQPDGVWGIGGMIDDLAGVVRLRSLGIELKMNEIYEGVNLEVSL